MKIGLDGKNGILLDVPNLDEIREAFSVENDNPRALFGARKYAITPTGRFEVGLWGEIQKNIEGDWNVNKEFLEKFNPKLDIKNIENVPGFKYYDYQLEAIQSMISNGRGIILVGTGGGKTLIGGGFCKTILKNYPKSKILVMVPSIMLLNQTFDEFKKFGLSVTCWGGENIPDLDKSILVANYQILLSDIKRTLKIVKNYNFVLVDECHKQKRNNKINKIIHNIYTDNKFGFTGTLPDSKLDEWNVIGKIGPVIYKKSSVELRGINAISNVKAVVIKLEHKDQPNRVYQLPIALGGTGFVPTAQYTEEINFLYNKEWRNKFIIDMADKLKGNVLILVDRIEHGTLLKQAVNDSGVKRGEFIQGLTDDVTRDSIKHLMESNTDIVCVAMSSIFSTGVSVKNLKYVIFVCIGKSKTKVIQSIGRSLRLHPDKKQAVIFDITDNTEYSSIHNDKRLEFYEEEQISYEIKKIKE